MEEAGIIKGLPNLDYVKLGYSFIAYVGILEQTSATEQVLESLKAIPFITVAHITTGKFNGL